ncbi:MAG: hypothetical protein Q4B10_00850 [Actinomycetaceae bacterium]|nr:hypothetical protein [Actinomycetaceae bacterium]
MRTGQEQREGCWIENVSRKTQRWIGIGLVVALQLGVIVLALADHPVFASRLFALGLVGVAAARCLWRRQPVWFAARSWWWDAVLLVVCAIAIAYLSFYGGRVMPSLV